MSTKITSASRKSTKGIQARKVHRQRIRAKSFEKVKKTPEEGYDSDEFIADKRTRVVDVYENDENDAEIPTKAFKGNITQRQ